MTDTIDTVTGDAPAGADRGAAARGGALTGAAPAGAAVARCGARRDRHVRHAQERPRRGDQGAPVRRSAREGGGAGGPRAACVRTGRPHRPHRAHRTHRAHRACRRTERDERAEHAERDEPADERAARAAAAARAVTQGSRRAGRPAGPPEGHEDAPRDAGQRDGQQRDGGLRDQQREPREGGQRQPRDGGQAQQRESQTSREGGQQRETQQPREGQPQRGNSPREAQPRDGQRQDEDELGGRRRRGRYRDRDRTRRPGGRPGGQGELAGYDEPEVSDDDVLLPVAGILDILDNYAFVRTSGYLPGPNDVYVLADQVKKTACARATPSSGAVRQPREGEQRRAGPQPREVQRAGARSTRSTGRARSSAKGRVEFGKLTPLYPQERLRLETEPDIMTTRVIDLVAPIGKGQRGLIVSPPKAGKTMVLQAIANAITTNNPEVHLMVVLVDERPEEVTDMQRTVKGEVIASTFDRPADDHTTVAELAIERAKRLVELGHDVVVLLDSITRLGRAYNIAAPASAAASCPAASTPARSTRPSASSAPPATSRTAAR